jgi:hypothetical protein
MIKQLTKSTNIILFFKQYDEKYKCLICNNNNYEEMKEKYNEPNILIITLNMLFNILKSENNFTYKYMFSNQIECISGKSDFKNLRNYIILNDNHETNLKNIYNYLLNSKLKKNEYLFYLIIFYQLLNGQLLYETINTTDEMLDFISKNNELLTDIDSFKKDLFDTYKAYYLST